MTDPKEEIEYVLPETPDYGRQRLDQAIENLKQAAIHVDPSRLSHDDLVILHDAIYEMDRHLPDFFEDDVDYSESDEDEDGSEEE